jgi:hypothetical protein
MEDMPGNDLFHPGDFVEAETYVVLEIGPSAEGAPVAFVEGICLSLFLSRDGNHDPISPQTRRRASPDAGDEA